MFQRFISTLAYALVAVSLAILTPAAHARQMGSPFIYTIDRAALTAPRQSPALTALSAQMFHDVAPSPNLNGWVCTSNSAANGGCPQITMVLNKQKPTAVKVIFTNQTTHATAAVMVNVTKTWFSLANKCALDTQNTSGVGMNDAEPAPTTPGDCSTMAPLIQLPVGALGTLASPGLWLGELDLQYMNLTGGNYVKGSLDTQLFQITVSDQDGSDLFLSQSGLQFQSPMTGTTGTISLYLYDPNHGTPNETPLQLRFWDDLISAGRTSDTFSMITQFGKAVPGLESTLDYTVTLSGGNVPLPQTINNSTVYTISLRNAPTVSYQGVQCVQISLTATLKAFSLVTKSSGFYTGRLHIAFGKAL